MKNKHTPGPWRSMAWGETISIDGAEITGLAFLNPKGNHNAGIPSAEDTANARLIAASPGLLVALENALAALNDMRYCAINGQEPGAELRGKVREIELAGEAAIAKAKGDK